MNTQKLVRRSHAWKEVLELPVSAVIAIALGSCAGSRNWSVWSSKIQPIFGWIAPLHETIYRNCGSGILDV